MAALFVAMSFPAYAQFEGAIDMIITNYIDGKPEQMLSTMFVKKDMLAAQMQGEKKEMGGGKFIFRGDKQLLWIVSDEEKMYVELSLKDKGEDTKSREAETKEKKKSKSSVNKTGKKQTILGYSCDEYEIKEDNEVTSLWGTAKLGNIYEGLAKSMGKMAGAKGGVEMEEWETELMKMNLFPLKIVTTKDGKVTESQEVTKIEAKSLQATIFEPPVGYQKQSMNFDMQEMMKQMQEQMKKEMENDTTREKDDEDDDE